jgi:hypothetical protein
LTTTNTLAYYPKEEITAVKNVAKASWADPGNPYSRGKLSTINLLIEIACFVKQLTILLIQKGADEN